jgi:tetratricopeptide (TPR) repeat protein
MIMANPDNAAGTPVSSLQAIWAILVRLAGAIAGAAGLTFGIGFVLVNLSLLKHGVYEGGLVRERYVGAGISFVALLAGAILIALAACPLADWLLKRWPRVFRTLAAAALAAVLDYVLALVVWGFKGLLSVSWALFVWTFVAGWLGLLLLVADQIRWARALLFRKASASTPPPPPSTSPAGPPQPSDRPPAAAPQSDGPAQVAGTVEIAIPQMLSRAESPAYLIALGILFFVLLLTYGQYVYETLPAALGGGLPVVVQFTGSEADMAALAQMGVPLEGSTITDQLELIGQTGSRYIVLVRQTRWEESLTSGRTRVTSRRTALAFDKELVQGVHYYPSEYYLSDEFAAVIHVQQGDGLFAQEFYDGAIDEYSEAIRRRPDYYLAYFKRGLAYLNQARKIPGQQGPLANLAASDLEHAKDLNPGDALYWYHLALAQTLAGQHGSAMEALREATDRDPSYLDQVRAEPLFDALRVRADLDFDFEELLFGSIVEAARAYAGEGQTCYAAAQEAPDAEGRRKTLDCAALAYARAITLTLTATDVPLERASYQVALAAVYQAQGKLDDAISQLEQAVNAAPDNEGYHLQLAQAYAAQLRWADAQREYEAVLERNSQNVSAWLGKGHALLQRADHRRAAEAFQRASDLAPEEVTAWYGLCVARLAFAPAEAEVPLRRVVTLDPTYAITVGQVLRQAEMDSSVREHLAAVLQAAEAAVRGDAFLKADDLVQAINEYSAAVEKDPDNVAYLVKLGDTYARRGDTGAVEAYAQAADVYRRLIEKAGDEPSYHFRLATVYTAQGEDAAALDAYNVAIGLAPDVAAYYAARAVLYVRLGRAGDAIADYEQAISLEAGNHLYYGQAGKLYYEQAQHDKAIAALTTATGLNPQYAAGFYYLGLAHLGAGAADAARVAFTQCTVVAQDEIQRRQCEEQLAPLVTPTP